MATKITNGLDLLKTNLTQAVIHPISGSHPTSPSEGQIWYRSDDDRLYIETTAGVKGLAFTSDGSTGVLESAFNANTILAATTDDTPAALTIPEQTLVGRITGGDIDALTAAEIRTLLGIEANAAADQNASEVPFTPAGDIAASNVQAAIQELDTEKTTEAYVDGEIAALGSLASQSEAALTDIAQIAGETILGNSAGTTGDVAALDATAVKGILSLSSSDLSDGTDLATQTYVDNAVSDLIDSAPAALDTLNEIAASLNDDADFAGTMTTALAAKTDKYTTTIGDTTSTSIAVSHGLNTRDVVVSVRETSGHAMVIADWTATSTSVVTFSFNTAPGTNEYTVVIVG